MNNSLQKIWTYAVLAACAISSTVYGSDASTPLSASTNTPLPNYVTAQQLWPRITQLIALGHGYLTKEDVERALGYKLPIFTPGHEGYEAQNSISRNTNYFVRVYVTSHTLTGTYHGNSSQVNFDLPQDGCLNLFQVRQELARAGFKRRGTIGLTSAGPMPLPPSETYGDLDSVLGYIQVGINIDRQGHDYNRTGKIEDAEASGVCVSNLEIDGRPSTH